MTTNLDGTNKCSFCSKEEQEIRKLVAGPSVYICDECIQLCSEIIQSELDLDAEESSQVIADLKPHEIKNFLDSYIIGQDDAKRKIAVAVYNHYKRINIHADRDTEDNVEVQKSNILVLGPTGSGKTLIAQAVAKVLNVPFAIADATSLTEAGYAGDDVENILLRLIQAADFDIERAEKGIIYIDEIDKIVKKNSGSSTSRDVSGEGVQQALLKILEGTIANVPPQGGRKHPNQDTIQIDTSNILFICGGAFAGIEKQVEKRKKATTIGFSSNENKEEFSEKELYHQVTNEDIMQYGLIPEFMGRLPVLVSLETLDEKALIDILTKPKNALVKQYQRLMEVDNIELTFEDKALQSIAKEAIERKTGARGLRSIIENFMNDIMFEVPARDDVAKVKITEEYIKTKDLSLALETKITEKKIQTL